MTEVKYTDDGRIKLYVGSLPFDTRGEDLSEMFSKYGNVSNGKFTQIILFEVIFVLRLLVNFIRFSLVKKLNSQTIDMVHCSLT